MSFGSFLRRARAVRRAVPVPDHAAFAAPDDAAVVSVRPGGWADVVSSPVSFARGDASPDISPTQHRDRRDWRSRWGRRSRFARHACDLLATVLLALLAVSNLFDVYGPPLAPVAATAVMGAATGALIAAMGLRPSWRWWWQLFAVACAQCVLGPLLACNGTALWHVLPTADTLVRGWEALFGSFKYLLAIQPPVGVEDGSLMALWTMALWTAFLAGLFAVMDDVRWSALAVPVVFAAFVAAAALGSAEGWRRAAAGVLAALMLTVWLSARVGWLEGARWPRACAVMALAAAVACGVCAAVPQHRAVLRDVYEPPVSPYDYTSPLSGLRAYIKDHKDDTVLTVRGLPAGTPVRLAVMDRFDGNVWNLSDSSASSGSGDYRRVGEVIGGETDGKDDGAGGGGEPFTAVFTVGEGLSETWLPLAGKASSVRFGGGAADGTDDVPGRKTSAGKISDGKTSDGGASGVSSLADASSAEDVSSADDASADVFYYNTSTDSAIYPSGLHEGLTYAETGVVPDTPSDRQIDRASSDAVAQPEAREVPQTVARLAVAVAGGRATGGEAARALARYLSEEGWFSHGLEGDYPSLAGHGNRRLTDLLEGTAMVGDSEQYASAMALMARELGLSSRVVLGFVPKDETGRVSKARTKETAQGTLTEFTGNDVEAWVEIRLDGYGWVAFHPTPEETKVPDEDEDLTPPDPRTLVRQPPVPLSDPLRDDRRANGSAKLSGEDADETGVNLSWRRFMRMVGRVALYGSPLWALLAACAVVLAFKARRLRVARSRGEPARRVAAGWASLEELARQCGAVPARWRPRAGDSRKDAPGGFIGDAAEASSTSSTPSTSSTSSAPSASSSGVTRRMRAKTFAARFGLDADVLDALAREADRAAFSGEPCSARDAERYWRDVDGVRAAMLAALPRGGRWLARLSLSGCRGPLLRADAAGEAGTASAGPAGIVSNVRNRFLRRDGGGDAIGGRSARSRAARASRTDRTSSTNGRFPQGPKGRSS